MKAGRKEVAVEQQASVVDVSCVEEVEAGLLKEGVVCVSCQACSMRVMATLLHKAGKSWLPMRAPCICWK